MALIAEGRYPHIHWIDIENDGTMVECAIMKQDAPGNIYYIQLDKLDSIDKQRLVKILKTRNIENLELWDAMSNVTLRNGINCLKYFHQLVRVLTPENVVLRPSSGQYGVKLVDANPNTTPTADEMAMAKDLLAEGEEAGVKPKAKRRVRSRKS